MIHDNKGNDETSPETKRLLKIVLTNRRSPDDWKNCFDIVYEDEDEDEEVQEAGDLLPECYMIISIGPEHDIKLVQVNSGP